MSSSRTERLLAFALVLLNASRPLSRSEIRQAVRDYPPNASDEAFERMFERDKLELRAMGLSIDTVQIDEREGLGYQLKKSEAFLPPINMTPDELNALACASKVWQSASLGHAAVTALRKLELVGATVSQESLGLNVSVSADSTVLTALLAAARERNQVKFTYRTAVDSAPTERQLQPWGVVAARGQWYAVGHDPQRNATRAFRLSRIVGQVSQIKKQADWVEPPPGDLRTLVASQFPAPQFDIVRLEVAPGTSARLRRLASGSDGDILTLHGVDAQVIETEILAACPNVKVLEPLELAESVSSSLRLLAERQPPTVSDSERAELAKDVKRRAKQAPESSNDQLGRLLALVPWLRAHPGVTYDQVAEHFGVSKERIERDLTLAVCTEFGSNLVTLDIDMWEHTLLVRDSRGMEDPLQFTETEAFALIVGLDVLIQLDNGAVDIGAAISAREKLRELVGSAGDITEKLAVDTTIRETSTAAVDVLAVIRRALNDKRALHLEYVAASQDVLTQRDVDPMGILTTNGVTYLQAWCRTRNEVRVFRLDRIQTVELLDSPAQVPADAGPLLTRIEPTGTIALVEVEPQVSWWADQVPVDGVVRTDRGTLLVQLQIANPEWLVRSALSLAGGLRIVDPTPLAEAVQGAARTALG